MRVPPLRCFSRPFARRPSLPPADAPAPSQFKKLLSPGKIGQTLCLGNLTDKHTYEYLRSIAPDLKIVKGRFDVEATSLPLAQVVTHGSLRVGFVEGFTLVSTEPDLLLAEANKLDVDVLCWGGTHRFDAFEYMDKFFVNPGSATGAFTTGSAGEDEEMVPSFCLMDVSRGRPAMPSPLPPNPAMADPLGTGPGNLPHAVRLPAEERRERGRERGGRESHIHKTGRADRHFIMSQPAHPDRPDPREAWNGWRISRSGSHCVRLPPNRFLKLVRRRSRVVQLGCAKEKKALHSH